MNFGFDREFPYLANPGSFKMVRSFHFPTFIPFFTPLHNLFPFVLLWSFHSFNFSSLRISPTMSMAHSSSSPSPIVGTGQRSDTPAEFEDDDEYERLMRSSPPLPEPDHLEPPSSDAIYNNQGQRWDDIIDPALSAAGSTSTAMVQPGGVRNESATARRLAEHEKLLPYQRMALNEFVQV
jgi:hypothetical protein